MTDINVRAAIGGNNPPDPIDQINTAHDAERSEAEAWLDGTRVENEGQMKAVDVLRKAARQWRIALETGQKSEAAPLHDAWKAALDRWKPTIEDAKRIEKGLVALNDEFKRNLAAERAEAERAARVAAETKAREAREAALKADTANIDAQRVAAQKQADAEAAQIAAAKASKANNVKGLRTVTKYEVTDHRALINWIAKNDRDAMTAFIEEYARKNHARVNADGVKVWTEKVAY